MWEDLARLVLYCLFAYGTMYLITGPPLERWLRRKQPEIPLAELQRIKDWLVFLWALVNLIIVIFWLAKYRSLGPF